MFQSRFSLQDNNPFSNLYNKQDDQIYKSPSLVNMRQPTSNSDLDKFNRESYASPFKMMANQNILHRKSQTHGDSQTPISKNDNIFQNPNNGLQNEQKNNFADIIQNQNKQKSAMPMQQIGNQLAQSESKKNRNFKLDFSGIQNEGTKNNKLEQSFQEYKKHFSQFNNIDDIQANYATMLNYLNNQESELIQQLGKLQNFTQSKDLKLKHLQVVSQLLNAIKQQQGNQIKSKIQVIEDGNVESISYDQSEGFNIKWHLLEKIPNDVESIQIEYGIFRKGDLLKTYRQTEKLATISYNWKFNKCVINSQEIFRNIYPTQYTFIYFDVKIFGKNVKEPKSWCWTLHTLFTEDKKLLQGCFKLPLYSKNHIPHAIFQTGFPFMSDCFLYIEVYLKQDYQMGNTIDYEKYVIPQLHLKERQLDQIEEDVVINQFVEQHIKEKGMIKSTFRDDELSMREYNARQKINLMKKKEQKQPLSNREWQQNDNQRDLQQNKPQKSYIKKEQDIVSQGDIFDQISTYRDRKKQTQSLQSISQQLIQETSREEEDNKNIKEVIQEEKEEKEQDLEEQSNYVYQHRNNLRKNTKTQLSQTSINILKRREQKRQETLRLEALRQQEALKQEGQSQDMLRKEPSIQDGVQERSSQQERTQQSHNTFSKPSRASISQTMQKIMEKRNQDKKTKESYISNTDSNY